MSALDRARRNFRTYVDNPLVIDCAAAVTFTYGEFHRATSHVADVLRERGVRHGDRVAILLPNGAGMACSYFACAYLGALAVPIDTSSHDSTVTHIFESTSPIAIIVGSQAMGPFTAVEGFPGPAVHVTMSNTRALAAGQPAVALIGAPPTSSQPFPALDHSDPWSVTHTSGTTSTPKGVVHSATTLFGNAAAFVDEAGLDAGCRFHNVLPMSHMAGFLNSLLCPFIAGGSVVIAPAFGPQSAFTLWRDAIDCGATTMWASPTMLRLLVAIDRDTEFAASSRGRVREVFACTAPLTMDVKRGFEDKYGVVVRQSYGTSEQLIITLNDPAGGDPEDAVGRPLDGVELVLLNDEGEMANPGEDGEISIRSRYEQLGYFGTDSPLPSAVSGGDWIPTGDVGRISERGTLVVTDRKSDIIIKGGTNISPAAVETAFTANELVEECVAVGVEDDLYGEVVGLGLRLRAGMTLQSAKQDLITTLRERLNPIQRPTYMLEFAEFPRTATGKVIRRKVQIAFAEQLDCAVVVR